MYGKYAYKNLNSEKTLILILLVLGGMYWIQVAVI